MVRFQVRPVPSSSKEVFREKIATIVTQNLKIFKKNLHYGSAGMFYETRIGD